MANEPVHDRPVDNPGATLVKVLKVLKSPEAPGEQETDHHHGHDEERNVPVA
jgi:hypothetical protein